MNTNTSVMVGAGVVLILILSPFLGMAAQRALTLDSLEKGYASRITALDAGIASTTAAMNLLKSTTERADKDTEYTIKRGEFQTQILRLKQERTTTEVAYKLLKESMR